MSLHPQVKWAQRPDVVYLTVLLPDAKDSKVNLDPEGVFTFSATAGAGDRHYELKLELLDKVNVEESKISIGVRSIVCVLQKAEPKWWNKLLRGDAKTPHYVKVDWDKWVDEDDEADAGPGDMDMNSMDFSKFGDMAGMMGGMGGDMGDDLDDSDDEEQEVTKPSAKADEKVDGEPKEEGSKVADEAK
uniref:Co-chaperone protein p23 n=2 Tax=Nicotiana TaxID=4085 RepID=A0A1S3ZC30_TOBAC|nr:PREDICTED: uncharacterized protein OsI_027940-like isoform X2 [Nicotiana sylvestris]XP_016461899.1 PREDICTED: uncharacterized protein OsI_027940-like isoform X2 [Nicotiana tabacum]